MSEMLEKILSEDNIKTAYKRVYANKGAGCALPAKMDTKKLQKTK